MRTESWERFLRLAAYVRGNPRFEDEERHRHLETARMVRDLLEGIRQDGALHSRLGALLACLYDPARPYGLIGPPHINWLEAWAASDEASLSRALTDCWTPSEAPGIRFARFARTAQEAEAAGAIQQRPRLALAWGALLNFVMSPKSLPAVRPNAFEWLERRLGHQVRESGSIVEQYQSHVAFARWLQRELKAAGFPIRDMLDVQALVVLSASRRELWKLEPAVSEATTAVGVTALRDRDARHEGPYLSVCSCLGYAAPYLLEWIEFHRLAGVERFFLYNNADREGQSEILAPYVDEGIVVLHEWTVSPPQIPAYTHCVREHGQESRWIAFIDSDEFLFSPTGEPVPQVLADYEASPGVGVNWVMFGTSGHRRKPRGLVIENYLVKLNTRADRHIKSIVDPTRVASCESAHHFSYLQDYAVDENHYPISGLVTTYISSARLRINHYFTRSEDEFRAKLARARADTGTLRGSLDVDHLTRPKFGAKDEAILSYLPALRDAVRAASQRYEPA
jgi:hypothetical protein